MIRQSIACSIPIINVAGSGNDWHDKHIPITVTIEASVQGDGAGDRGLFDFSFVTACEQ